MFIKNNKINIDLIISVLFVFLIFLISFCALKVRFLTNDDPSIHHMLSGEALNGEIYRINQYIHPFLSITISRLYEMCNVVNWWLVYSILLIFISIVVINYIIIKLFKKNNQGVPLLSFILIIMTFAFYLPIIIEMNFATTTSIVFASIFFYNVYTRLYGYRKNYLANILILAIICMTRDEIGKLSLIVLSIFECVDIFIYIKSKKISLILSKVVIIVLYVATYLLLVVSYRVILTKVNGEEFLLFNNMRARFVDYPIANFYENQGFYNSIGFDEYLFNLCKRFWFMLDKNYNLNNLSKIVNYNKQHSSLNISIILSRIIKKNVYILMLYFSAFAIFVLNFFNYVKNTSKISLYFILGNLLFLISFSYLLINGRINHRAIYAVFLFCFLINLSLFIYYNYRYSFKFFVLWLFVVAFLFFLGTNRNYEYYSNLYLNQLNYFNRHSENFYIANTYIDFCRYDQSFEIIQYPTNVVLWGSSLYNSDFYYKVLKLNEFDSLDCNAFTKDNVYFATCDRIRNDYNDKNLYELNSSELFYKYLLKNYNYNNYTLIDNLNDRLFVYKFIK